MKDYYIEDFCYANVVFEVKNYQLVIKGSY